MGLLDDLSQNVTQSQRPGNAQYGLADAVARMISNSSAGGLSGLVQQFTQKGLGEIVSSWISAGQNLPITPDQIQHALGKDTVGKVAQSLGIDTQDASAGIAEILPQIVDKLTPAGSLPSEESISESIRQLGKKLFGG